VKYGKVLWSLGLVFTLVPAGILLGAPAQAIESKELSQVDSAISDLNTCLASFSEPVLDVFFLMDGSGSLANDGTRPGADPEGIRFEAVEQSIAPLAELAGGDVKVNIAAGTFGDQADTVFPWTQVTVRDASDISQEISLELKESFNKENTNWVAGLELAEQELATKRAEGPRCQTLIWVTDGGIYLANNTDLNAKGIEDICGNDPSEFGVAKAVGSMFRLRNANVVVLGFLLKDPNMDSQSRVSYFGPVVEGNGEVDASYFGGDQGIFSCGQIVEGAAGAAIPASSPSILADALWAISICITENCVTGLGFNAPLSQDANGDWVMPVTSGIATAVIRPRSESVQVFDPSGNNICSDVSVCSLKDGSIRIPVLGNSGVWRLSTGESVSPVVRFLTEIELKPEIPSDLVAGEPAAVSVLVTQAGETLRTSLYDEAGVSWTFESDDGKTSNGNADESGQLQGFAPQAGGKLTVSFSALVQGQNQQGIEVPSLSVEISYPIGISVRPVGDYPTLIGSTGPTPKLLVFPELEGAGSSTAAIRITGPDSGQGLVCLAPPIVDSDPGAAEVGRNLIFSSEYDCAAGGRQIGAGETMDIPITVNSDRQFSGIARGKIIVQLQPVDGGKVFPESIEFELPSTLERSTGAALGTFIFLTVLGLVVPYLGLLYFARRQATFSDDLSGARFASLPIRLGPEGLIEIGDKPVSDYSFIYMNPGSVQRAIETAGVTHKIYPPKVWPFAPIRCDVTGPMGSLTVSNLSGDLGQTGPSAPSSQALPDVFAAYFEPPKSAQVSVPKINSDWISDEPTSYFDVDAGAADGTLSGTLVVILPASSDPIQSAERSLAKVRVWPRWTEVYSAIRSQASKVVEPSVGSNAQNQVKPIPDDPLSDW